MIRISLLFCFLIFFSSNILRGETRNVFGKTSAVELGVNPVSLIADPVPSNFRVPAPTALMSGKKIENSCTVNIIYLGAGQGMYGDNAIPWPDQAKTAFTFAAEIWATTLTSTVPITIKACWADNLGSGVLGHSATLDFFKDFSGAPQTDTWYPATLANALAGTDLEPSEADIYIAYSSTFTWYYGTDGNCPDTEFDLVTVAAHEIGHGVGFAGSMRVSGGVGSWGGGTSSPIIYDRFTQNGAGQWLIKDFPNNSVALAAQLTGGDLFFNGTKSKAAYGGQPPPLFAPSSWMSGSSYSHLSEIFNGTSDALMTYSVAPGESIHNVGPVTNGIFQDIGWSSEPPPVLIPTISLSTDQLTQASIQGTNAASQTFSVWNSGLGTLKFSIADDVTWLSCTPVSGSSTGKSQDVSISVDYSTASLAVGNYLATITVTDPNASNSPKTVQVSLQVLNQGNTPIIALSTNQLSPVVLEKYDAKSETFSVWNSGKGTLQFSVADNAGWLSCTPTSGSSTSESQTVAVTVNYSTASLALGTYSAEISITDSNAGNSPQAIAVTLQVVSETGTPTISVSTKTLAQKCSEGADADSQSFSVWNSGDGALKFNLTDDVGWLSCNPVSGVSVDQNDIALIKVNYDTASLKAGIYGATITITDLNASNNPQVITVTLNVVRLAEIEIDKAEINVQCALGTNAVSQTFTVTNIREETTLYYNITENVEWLHCVPSSGVVNYPLGEQPTPHSVNVIFTTNNLPIGTYQTEMTIADINAINSPQVIKLNLTVGDPNEIPVGDKQLALMFSDNSQSATVDLLNNVTFWSDYSGKGNNLFQASLSKCPVMQSAIKGVPVLYFNSKNSLEMLSSLDINSGGPYTEKTIVLFFRTGGDVMKRQLIFEQGDRLRGLNIYIDSGYIYFNAWNLKNDSGANSAWGPIFTFGTVVPNTNYSAFMLFDSASREIGAYLNGTALEVKSGVSKLYAMKESVSLGNVTGTTLFHDRKSSSSGFNGFIGAFVYYNQILTFNQVTNLTNYLTDMFKDNFTVLDNYYLWLDSRYGICPDTSFAVKTWLSMATGRKIRMSQPTTQKRPFWIKASEANNYNASLSFNGTENFMASNSTTELNSSKVPYKQKTLFLIFKTGTNIVSRQVIWAQGDPFAGFNIYLQNGNLYYVVWNKDKKTGWGMASLNSVLEAETLYSTALVFDSTNAQLSAYIGGKLIGTSLVKGDICKHKPASVGSSNNPLMYADGLVSNFKGNFFKGNLFQSLMYNNALSVENLNYLFSYFSSEFPALELSLSKNAEGKYVLSQSAVQGLNPPFLTFNVSNSGGKKLDFTVSSESSWFSCNPTSGTSTGIDEKVQITVTFNSAALVPGVYEDTIRITDRNAINSPIFIYLTLTVVP